VDEITKALEALKQEMQFMHQEIQELQTGKKGALPDGWRLIQKIKKG